MLAGTNGTERILAIELENFQAERQGAVLQVQLNFAWSDGKRPERFQLEQQIFLPNRSL
ncbi:MAG: hypothetical protein U0931_14295 [Vulcanimicrobiota bacterium]